ncbi:hypothetical protein [Rhizobium sp. G21]|uniref:hypothetical protein n=1 Tax=Rhizobium sp. G21 TaxID=2758439 RepID=UPI0015FFCD46|nr:hypothetical protein [Rhizobium sp. G21]MBB1249830.1 hypothetical protein [Rhizobium sp. G21]
MDMGDKGIFQNKIPAENWAQEASHDRVLSDWSWLYAYEAIRKGWMPDPHNLLQKPFFKAMHDRDVVFYDPEKNVRSSWSLRRDMASERARQTTEVVELLNSLRGAVDFDQWENY